MVKSIENCTQDFLVPLSNHCSPAPTANGVLASPSSGIWPYPTWQSTLGVRKDNSRPSHGQKSAQTLQTPLDKPGFSILKITAAAASPAHGRSPTTVPFKNKDSQMEEAT